MPTSTVEDYLKSILIAELKKPGELVTMGQVGAALDVAPGTVTAMVKTLAESGLVHYEPYAGVRLSSAGRKLALHVLRRHRLVELFLVEVMGLDWSEVHDEAERLEHVISDRMLARMDEILGFPSVDPHGDPIPSAQGVAQGVVEQPQLPTLLLCPTGRWQRLARVEDQGAEFLRLLERSELRLGSHVQVETRDEVAEVVDLRLESGESMTIGFRAAAKLQVEPVPQARVS